jgi:SSS family solute:Na+ symporter
MWSVALTTFFQMIVIVLGLFYIAWLISSMTGGVAPVIAACRRTASSTSGRS